MLVRIVNGTLRPKDKIRFMATEAQHLVESVGVLRRKIAENEADSRSGGIHYRRY